MSRSSEGTPLYHQIKEYLLEQIASGHLRVGDRVPPEEQLAERFSVSRMTARHAVMELVREGRVYRRRGAGTFVIEPKIERRLARLTTLTEELERQGQRDQLRSDLLSWNYLKAGETLAELFGVEVGSPMLRVARVRSVGTTPIALQVWYMPSKFTRGLRPEDLTESMYKVLEDRFKLPIHYADQHIEAVAASAYQARHLDVSPGTPVLLVRRRTYLATGELIELGKTYYRSDRYHFRLTLYR